MWTLRGFTIDLSPFVRCSYGTYHTSMKFGRAAVNYYLYYINSFCDYFFDSLFDRKVQCDCRDSYASHLVTTLVQMDYIHGFQRMNPFGLFL